MSNKGSYEKNKKVLQGTRFELLPKGDEPELESVNPLSFL